MAAATLKVRIDQTLVKESMWREVGRFRIDRPAMNPVSP